MAEFEETGSWTSPHGVILATDGRRIIAYDGKASHEVSVETVRSWGVDVEVNADGFIESLSTFAVPLYEPQ